MLVDPRRIKNVSGRKTDVLDCQWLQQLHTYGLLSGAFRPDADIRRLRSYLRHRAMLVEYASHHIQHMQKALTQMHVKLQHVSPARPGWTLSRPSNGERDPRKLAQPSPWHESGPRHHRQVVAGAPGAHLRADPSPGVVPLSRIAGCDREIEVHLERFEDQSRRASGLQRSAAQSGQRGFDIRTHLYRMPGWT